MTDVATYEKLNLLYLGRELDPETAETTRLPFLYKHKHLTTHAAIIGMTGSGKTGLGIGLLEEAAIDKIPAIVIDPKGDMGNLLLSFPDMDQKDFLPWIDPLAAEQQGLTVEALAGRTAETWEQGIGSWDQDKERIRRMRDNTDFQVYTPGSTAVRPVSVLDSMDAPDSQVLEDNETLVNLVNASVSSLLGLLGIEADPLKSREHILLSSLVLHHWRQGQNLGLESLINAVMQPPFDKVGVFPLETFYPRDKRMELAMQLNTILASPAFSGWTQGEPLNIDDLLYGDSGKPRISIFSIAHLGEEERMFFVTMLLGKLISWMRRQEGSSGLRCLLYMDEIFGYFPPTANPPSKKPMLLLLKQARAYGLGVVLATQNPVDLDYKGLANIGTWFIGRLQTKQDQDKVLAGIGGGSQQYDAQELRRMLADMRGRTFLMSSAHRDEPILFETRWVLSYLKGPISLNELGQISQLQPTPEADHAAAEEEKPLNISGKRFSSSPPLINPGLQQCFVPSPIASEEVQLSASIAGTARVRIFNQARAIDMEDEVVLKFTINDGFGGVDWDESTTYPVDLGSLPTSAPAGASFAELPAELGNVKHFKGETKALSDFLYHSRELELMRVKALKLESQPGEQASSFRRRLADVLAEKAAGESAKIEERYQKKQRQLETRLEKAYAKIDKEKGDVRAKGIDTALSFGVAVFGALFGRKSLSVTTARRSASGMRSAGRFMKEKGDVQRANADAARLEEELNLLAEELQDKLAQVASRFEPTGYPVESFALRPRRSDIFDVQVCLLWEPVLDFSDINPA